MPDRKPPAHRPVTPQAFTRLRLAIVLAAALLAGGCATFRSYQFELSRTIDLVEVGHPDKALETFERFNRRSRSSLLYFMEKGELLRIAGRYTESQQAWFEADAQVQKWESSALANPERVLGAAASLLVSDASRPYEGQDYEKVMLTTRMALNHLALGEWDLARVAIRRTHEREALIARLREQQVRKLEEQEGDKARAGMREIDGYPVRTIDNPGVNALRNSYQSAFSHYLAGFVYEALGEPSLAAAGYRQAIELQPGVALLEQGLDGLDGRVFDRGSGLTDVLVVIETGSAPARASTGFNLPVFTDAGLLVVPMSFPVIREQSGGARARAVSMGEVDNTGAATITSVDLMARRALKDDMPLIMLRAVARATAKGVLQAQARRRDDTGLAGALAIIGTVITERADERSWRTLPAEIAIARLSVAPGTQLLEIETESGRQALEVNVSGRYALICVRLIGGRAYVAATPAPPGQSARAGVRHIGLR